MKKAMLLLVLVVGAAGGVFAQTWYDSFAPGIDTSKVLINAGIGFGGAMRVAGVKQEIPPISASADFKLPGSVPITVGALVALATQTDSQSIPTTKSSYKFTYTDFAIGARGMYHFNFLPKLDAYAGLVLGWVLGSAKEEYTGDWPEAAKSVYKAPGAGAIPYFLFGANIGARYFFTDTIGAYLELGYSRLQVASLGLSVKF
jgi:hypothetical protein